jgi:hypothetical protein
MAEIDFSILQSLRNGTAENEPRNALTPPDNSKNEPRNAPEPPPKEPPREEPTRQGDALGSVRTLSEEQRAYIDRTKGEILEKVYCIEDTPDLLLKALGALCVALNDKAFYNQVARLINNIWLQGVGKVRTLEGIPREFILQEIQGYTKLLKENLAEKQLDTFARADIERSIDRLTEKEKGICKGTPDTSKGKT